MQREKKAFSDAIFANDLVELRRLLDEGAEIEQRGHFGWTPLMTAIQRGDASAVRCFSNEAREWMLWETTPKPLWPSLAGRVRTSRARPCCERRVNRKLRS